MTVKISDFRENWVGIKVSGMKTTAFAIFEPSQTYFLDQQDQIRNYLNWILVKKKGNYFVINFVTSTLTK